MRSSGRWRDRTSSPRLGQAEAIAKPVCSLGSDEDASTSGQSLVIDGDHAGGAPTPDAPSAPALCGEGATTPIRSRS